MPGEPPEAEGIRLRIGGLLNDALGKAPSHPYVIFLDLNVPPSSESPFEKPWFRQIVQTIDHASGPDDQPDPFSLLVFTNFPHHYDQDDDRPSKGSYHVVLSPLT